MAFLGVIGGLGPMASAYFIELLTAMTDAQSDQEHMNMMLLSAPAIPDRTQYILGKSKDSPLPGLISAGRVLCGAGADLLAIPCVTAHYFHNDIERQLGIPVIHAIRECVKILKENGITRAGLMATDGTVRSGLFQAEFEEQGISVILPAKEEQEMVMSFIYDDVKKGGVPSLSRFEKAKECLIAKGAEAVLLGCTELSLIKKEYGQLTDVLDVMEVLAKASLEACGMPVREEYRQLMIRSKQYEAAQRA